ncbi:MAG: GAF domain-containing protein [Anaerolineae bacterium]|nr:GAF domain-containing protein [Anaerolineae bacterium]
MIRRLTERFFDPRYSYDNPLDVQHARALLVILSFAIVGSIIYSAILLFYVIVLNAVLSPALVVTAIAPIVAVATYVMVNRGYLQLAIIITIIVSGLGGYYAAFDGFGRGDVIAVVIAVVVAGVMLDWRGTFVTVAVMIGLLMQIAFFSPQADNLGIGEDFAIISLILIIVGSWITVFGSNIQSMARRSFSTVEDLKSILSRVSQTGINTDEQHLSADVIDILRDRLGYTYARIFLTDENSQIRQSIAVGLNKTQINVETQIQLGSESAIYEAIRTRRTVLIESDGGAMRQSHLLPAIQSAAAVPIYVEQQFVGVLDVQREVTQPFDSDEVDMLELLAQHLGGTIVQARLMNELRANLSDQNEIVTLQRAKMLEYEQAEERATISTWKAYLEQRGLQYLGFDMATNTAEPTLASKLSQDLRPALETGKISVRVEDNFQMVSVPILLRGRTLGAMSFKVAQGSQSIGTRQTELIRSVVQRLGLALENKRLFEQSRAQAQRESKANEVGSLLLSSTDIETVLNLAAQNFNETLGAVQTKIHLQPETRRATEG